MFASQSGPVRLYFLVSIEEFLVTPGLHPKAHGIECGHGAPPI
jgi:hypothetical protein